MACVRLSSTYRATEYRDNRADARRCAMTAEAAASSASGRTVEVNGVTVYYEEHGEGTPLMLVHGGLVSSAMWGALLPHLAADGCRLILPDSRGHGRSSNPSGQLSYAR